jgi:rubrerythrin
VGAQRTSSGERRLGSRRVPGEPRRGFARRAAVLVASVLALAAAGCGGDDPGEAEKAADVEILDAALARELTAAQAYARGLPRLRGELVAVARELRAQELEHASAIAKAIRGLGGSSEARAERLDFSGVGGGADFLALAYEIDSEALAGYVEAAPQLTTEAPRTLAAALAASHAQHLVVLRRGLGAGPAASVPEAFDTGELPPPSGRGG